MKVSASASRGVALVALMRSNRLASIWRSSGVMSLSESDRIGRAEHMDPRYGQSKTGARYFAHGSDAPPVDRGATLLRPADRLRRFRSRPRLQLIAADAGVLLDRRSTETVRRWPMWSLSAPSGATREKARSSIGC